MIGARFWLGRFGGVAAPAAAVSMHAHFLVCHVAPRWVSVKTFLVLND